MGKRIRSPIRWFGGKGNMIAKLLPLIPEHRIWVEVFGGGASLTLAKAPSPVEVYNDIDGRLVNLFKVLRDPAQFQELERLVSLTLCSRQEWAEAMARMKQQVSPVERAWAFYTAARQSFAGNLSAWSYVRTESSRGMASKCSSWLSAIEMLPDIHQRLMRVQIECSDWRRILKNYDTPETCFYLDPPYVARTRRRGSYAHELSDDDHSELVEMVQQLQGMVMLSGYPNELYAPLEQSWRKVAWKVGCHAVGRTRATGLMGQGAVKARQSRTECVWMNFG